MSLRKWLSDLQQGRIKLGSGKPLILENVMPGTKSGDAVAYQQVSKLSGDNTFTGANTFDGATTFNGAITLGDAAADSMTVNATTTYAEPVNYANATGITAFATGGQASATALTEELNNVTTCATAGDSVKLPAAVAGKHVWVKNSGATALDVFPASSDSIDALAVNLAIRIQPGSSIAFYAKDAIVWESTLDNSITLNSPTTATGQLEFKAAASAGNTVTTVTNASQAAARTYTIPDAGASASFVMNAGASSIAGVKTFSDVTDATTKDTGAIVTEGGIGVEKAIFAGTSITSTTGFVGDTITPKTSGSGTSVLKPVLSAGAATLAPTTAQSGAVIGLAKADGVTVTLPACATAAIGVNYKFAIIISCTSVGYVINTTGTDVFIGGIFSTIANPDVAADVELSTSTVNKTITLDATTKGGLIGGWVEVTCISGTQWHVSGVTLGTGAIATPFSN